MMGSNEKIDNNYYEQRKLTAFKRQYVDTNGDAAKVIKLMYPDGATSEQYDEETIIKDMLNELFNLDNISGVSIQDRNDAWRKVCDNAFAPYIPVAEDSNNDGCYKNYYSNDDIVSERQRESILQSIRARRNEGSGNPYANIGSDNALKSSVKENVKEVVKINIINSLRYRKEIDGTGRNGKPELFFKI